MFFFYFFPFLFLSTDAAEGDKQKTKIFGLRHQTFGDAPIAFEKSLQSTGETNFACPRFFAHILRI
jgi:hypothetical protein